MTARTVDGSVDRAGAGRGFQPTARRRNRIAAGVALAAIAIGGNVLVYAGLDSSEPVVQTVRDVPAGEQLTADMFRTVDVDVDSTVNVISGDRLDSLVGSYAKVRLVSGSLVTFEAIQPTPLVTPGNSVVAIEIGDSRLPAGLRERVPVALVIPGESAAAGAVSVAGIVVGLPTETTSALGLVSLSVEVAAGDAATVAAADDVRVVLIEPSSPTTGSSDPEAAAGEPADEPAGEPDGEP